MMKRMILLLAAGLGLATVTSAQAAVIFASNPGGSWGTAGTVMTVGTPFSVGPDGAKATWLGFFDQNSDGLGFAHTVGIYNPAHVLMGSVTVPAGTSAPLHDGSRWAQLGTTIFLLPNTTYMLAATFSATGDRGNLATPANVTIGSGFTLAGSRFTYAAGAGLNYPSLSGSPNGSYIFGGNIESEPIPEPGQVAMMAVVLVGSVGAVWRHRKAKAARK